MNTNTSPFEIDRGNALNYDNIKFGMLVELKRPGGYLAGVKVHFFNPKGVLVGNVYEFVKYDQIRRRQPDSKGGSRDYPLYFYGCENQALKCWLYIKLLSLITSLIKYSQRLIKK